MKNNILEFIDVMREILRIEKNNLSSGTRLYGNGFIIFSLLNKSSIRSDGNLLESAVIELSISSNSFFYNIFLHRSNSDVFVYNLSLWYMFLLFFMRMFQCRRQ